MTGEEMERAIELILKSRANADARMAAFAEQQERTNQQIAETRKQIQAYMEIQSQCVSRLVALVERNITGGNGNS